MKSRKIYESKEKRGEHACHRGAVMRHSYWTLHAAALAAPSKIRLHTHPYNVKCVVNGD